MSIKTLITLLAMALFSTSVLAASIGDLKTQGAVGELPNGYLGVVDSSNSSASALVKDINAKRKAIYQKQASKNNISLGEVQKIAGKRNFQKTKTGNYIKVSGKWVKK